MCRIIPRLVITIIALTIAGCSTTSLTASWKNPEFNRQLDRVYLVGVSKNETTRRLFEDSFVRELAKYGVSGIASYKDIAGEEENIEKVMTKALANRADSILMSRIVDKRTETVVSPGRVTTYGRDHYPYDYPYPYYRSYRDYYSRRYETIYEPPTVNRFKIVTIESNLYATGSGQLIWSAQLEVTADGRIRKMIEDFIDVVTNDMKKKGLL